MALIYYGKGKLALSYRGNSKVAPRYHANDKAGLTYHDNGKVVTCRDNGKVELTYYGSVIVRYHGKGKLALT